MVEDIDAQIEQAQQLALSIAKWHGREALRAWILVYT